MLQSPFFHPESRPDLLRAAPHIFPSGYGLFRPSGPTFQPDSETDSILLLIPLVRYRSSTFIISPEDLQIPGTDITEQLYDRIAPDNICKAVF
jgi:hypothetical protein